MDEELVIAKRQELPDIIDNTSTSIGDILQSFNLPRNVIAGNEEIESAWRELPREISRIPIELRDGLVARMCVATSVGLFDGAINYMWNAVILNLRAQARSFGLGYISQALNRKFEEDDLNDLMDSELLDLCHKLELLSEEGYFFLSQCRDIRNNFSSAHPSIAQIDDRELINFISRCCKHGISADYALQGIHIAEFIDTIKESKLNTDACEAWCERLENTFPAQRALLIPMLHGVYCDPMTKEYARNNAVTICIKSKSLFESKIESTIIDQHNKYIAKGDDARSTASRLFFEKMDLLGLLTNSERHSIISSACKSLYKVHLARDNFYNEPPFARRLFEITNSNEIPNTVKDEYVQTVVMCYVGNTYGVSNAAIEYYEEMIMNFTPKEIDIMLNIPLTRNIISIRVKGNSYSKRRYFSGLELINDNSFTAAQKVKYQSLKRRLGH